MRKLLSSFLLLLLVTAAGAQSITLNSRPGAISREELELSSYPEDPEADAIVLYSAYNVEALFDNDRGFYRDDKCYERIKILTEKGKEHAEYKLYYSVRSRDGESISNVSVTTWSLENGMLSYQILPANLIFDRKVSEYTRCVSFAAPAVEVGCVVEVSYEFQTPYVGDIGTKFLQRDIPVNMAELTVRRSDRLGFNIVRMGTAPVMYWCEEEKTTRSFNYRSFDTKIYTDHYKAVDLPAIHKNEPFCLYTDIYRSAINYELNAIYIPGRAPKLFSTTWEDVDAYLKDAGCIKDFHAKNPLPGVEGIVKADSTEIALIVAVRNFVTDKVRWTGERRVRPDIRKAVKEGKGSTADINALISTILAGEGYKVDPVFYRTRDHGPLAEVKIEVEAFNSVLLRAVSPSGKVYYFDGSRDESFVNVVPEDALVDNARVVDEQGHGTWVDLSSLGTNMVSEFVDIEVSPSGTISGKVALSDFNLCSSSRKRERGRFASDQEYMEYLEKQKGLDIVSMDCSDLKSWSGQSRFFYEYSSEAGSAGDMLYVNPFPDKFHDRSAFKSPVRAFPVDFPYPLRINCRCTVHIPEGFEVASLPTSTVLSLPAVTCVVKNSYSRKEDGSVVVDFVFRMDGRVLDVEQYDNLRSFWENLCGIYDSVITLKKI